MKKKSWDGVLLLVLSVSFVLGLFAILISFDKSSPIRVYYCWVEPHIGIEPEINRIKEECKTEIKKSIDHEKQLIEWCQGENKQENDGSASQGSLTNRDRD